MPVLAAQSEAAIAVRTDLCAIFVSLELSRSTWLITSLSPGGGEKMSKYSVSAGDIEGLFKRFGDLQERARVRTGQSFAVVTIQEAGRGSENRRRPVLACTSEGADQPRARPARDHSGTAKDRRIRTRCA